MRSCFLLMIILVPLGYCSCSVAGSEWDGETATAERADICKTIALPGLIQPGALVDIKSQISGRVEEVFVEEGQLVTAGDPLVRLDSRPLMKRIAEQDALIHEAELRLEMFRKQLNFNRVKYQESLVERSKRMFEAGLIAEEEVDKAIFEYEEAVQNLEVQKRAAEVQEAAVNTARAMRETLEGQLEHTLITSPLSGVVLERHAEVGSGVSSVEDSAEGGSILLVIGSMADQSFVGAVAAAEVAQVGVGMAAIVRSATSRDETWQAVIRRISPKGEVTSDGITEFNVVVRFTNPPRWTRTNVPASAEITVACEEDVVAIPERFVRFEGPQAVVTVLGEDGVSEERDVVLGLRDGSRVEVLAGLTEGERVFVSQEK